MIRHLTETAVAYYPFPPTPIRAGTSTPHPTPESKAWPTRLQQVLPAPVYYLSRQWGNTQIWRVETNGKTVSQITRGSDSVVDFDVSPITGQLAYFTHRGIFVSDALGKHPQRIHIQASDYPETFFTGGSVGLNWSPDGKQIAFGYGFIWVYNVVQGKGFKLNVDVKDEYVLWPLSRAWSPDGKHLLVITNYRDRNGGRVLLSSVEPHAVVCAVDVPREGEITWSVDGRAIYASNRGGYFSPPQPGLWRMNTATLQREILIAPEYDAPAQFVHTAQEGRDGQLYYFHAAYDLSARPFTPQYQMYRSARDGVSDRALLRSDYYEVNEALWAPDMSLAVIMELTSAEGGRIILLTTDNKPPLLLADNAVQLRWGKP